MNGRQAYRMEKVAQTKIIKYDQLLYFLTILPCCTL